MNFIVIVMRALYRTLHETHITAQMKLNLHNAWGRQIRSDASHMRRTVEQIDRQARPMYGSSAHASYIGARSVVALCVCVARVRKYLHCRAKQAVALITNSH